MTSNVRPIFGGNCAVTFRAQPGAANADHQAPGRLLKLVGFRRIERLFSRKFKPNWGAQDGIR